MGDDDYTHGTTAYSHQKCRCAVCRAAVAAYNRQRKKQIRDGTWKPSAKTVLPVPCSIDGCTNLARFKTPQPLCGGHRQQLNRGATPGPLRRRILESDGHKVCSKCERRLPVGDFYMQNASKGHRQSMCKKCSATAARARRYGITFETAADLISGRCHCCGSGCEANRLHIDHDHKTGRVRGALCHGCNTALGLTREDPRVLLALVNYLASAVP